MPEWKSRPSDDPVLGGLAGNPAIPDELLARLIREHGPVLTWALGRVRPLPEAALAAMLGHPDYWVRVAVVENTSVDPGVVLGMADDAHPVVLGRISARPDVTLPEEYLPRLLERLEWYVHTGLMTRNEMFGEMDDRVRRDRRLLGVLARHPREDFRLAACRYGGRLDEADRQALAADPSPAVRAARTEALAEETRTLTTADLDGVNARGRRYELQRPLSGDLLDALLAGGDVEDLISLALNRHIPPSVVDVLVDHLDATIRRLAAARADLTPEQALRLAADTDPEVRAAVSVHPVLTEEQRAGINLAPDVTAHPARGHGSATKPEPGQTSVWARSVNPLLRQRAAQDPDLPADLAALLAEDPDEGVRTTLVLNHPAAPPHLLFPAYLEQKECGRKRLRRRRGFPTAGLARFAGDADPGLRVLAVLDPQAGPEVLAALLTDPDAEVRGEAARCPRLPVDRIVALLGDPELGRAAAANPALPVGAMQRLISRGPAGSAPG